jgi:hypothetical protein
MTKYEITRERDGVFDAWAVVATADDLTQRYVARYLTHEQAQTMVPSVPAVERVGVASPSQEQVRQPRAINAAISAHRFPPRTVVGQLDQHRRNPITAAVTADQRG